MHAGGSLVDRVPALNLVAEHVDVVVERLGGRERRLVGERNRLVDAGDRRIVQLLRLAFLEHPAAQEPLGERVDRIALAPLRDLLLRAVLLRVGHRVPAEAIRDGLDEDRLAVLARAPDRFAHRLVGLDHVHAVAAQAGHAEALAAAMQVGHGRVALDRGAHAELVVGDHEHDRQLPQGGEVERLAERPLVRRAVTEDADRDLVEPLVVGRERHPGGQRQVAADDPVAAHEAVLEVEHVHRPAAPLRDALLAPEQLGHDAIGVRPAGQRVPVRAVGRDQVVVVAHRPAGADDRRLLADRQVQEAADLGLRIHLPGALLEAPDEHHRLQPLARRVALRQLPGYARLLRHVGHERDSSAPGAAHRPRVSSAPRTRSRGTRSRGPTGA